MAMVRTVARRHLPLLPLLQVLAHREANPSQKRAKNPLLKRQKLAQEEEVQLRLAQCARERSKPKENSSQSKVIRANEGQNCSQSQLRFKSTKIYKDGTIPDLHSSQARQETKISKIWRRTKIVARESHLFCEIGKKAQRRRECPLEQRLPRRPSGMRKMAAVRRADREHPRSVQ